MYKALKSFACKDFSMAEGELRELNPPVAKGLIADGYIEAVTPEKPTSEPKKTKRKK